MKHILLLVAAILIVTACSSPRYTYNFDYYDYNSGRKHQHAKAAQSKTETEEHPLTLEERTLVASAAPIVLTEEDIPAEKTAAKHAKVSKASKAAIAETKNAEAAAKENAALLAKRYKELSKSQRKEFKAELKKQFKRYMKAKRTGDTVAANNATSNMDQDLKMAIIFGAVGLTLTLFGGINEAFWILGVIAIVVGVVFLVKWLVRQ
jgi:glycerol-3-phosphate O-acyltransferase